MRLQFRWCWHGFGRLALDKRKERRRGRCVWLWGRRRANGRKRGHDVVADHFKGVRQQGAGERGGVVCGGHVAKEDVRNGRGSVRWSAGRQRPGNSARGQVVAPTHRTGACPRTGVVAPLTCGPGHSVGRLKPFKSVNSI
jgi:hypothetical protein